MNKRSLLVTAALLVLRPPAGFAAGTGPADGRALAGTWRVSAVADGGPSDDPAVLSSNGRGELVLALEGELAKALGGPVALRPSPDGDLVGTAPSGERVSLRVVNARRLAFGISGPRTRFSLFLVR